MIDLEKIVNAGRIELEPITSEKMVAIPLSEYQELLIAKGKAIAYEENLSKMTGKMSLNITTKGIEFKSLEVDDVNG